jgi:hypothetical protein
MAISRSRTVELPLPLADAFEQCLKAREAVPRSSLKDFNERSGTITFGVRVSLKSWGERMTLQLREAGAASTSVEVTSQASFPLTLADYGKNAKNVQQVVDWLAKVPSSDSAGE